MTSPAGSADGFEDLPGPTRRSGARPEHRTRVAGLLAAAVVLLAGGTITYVALASGDSGAGTPRQAVQRLMTDLGRSDLVGVLSDLTPGERGPLEQGLKDGIASLQRLGAVQKNADLGDVKGVSIVTSNLRYAPDTVRISDTVQVVKIVGGTIDASADAAKLPFTQRFLHLATGGAGPASGTPATQHATVTAAQPIRIAAQRSGGRWYASLAYTAADQAANGRVPGPADVLPATGAADPATAVRTALTDVLDGDLRSLLELFSPDELAVVHTYGGMMLAQDSWHGAGVAIRDLQLSSQRTGNGARVTLKRLDITARDGRRTVITVGNGCLGVGDGTGSQRLCAANVPVMMQGLSALACHAVTALGNGSVTRGYVPPGSTSSAYSSSLTITPSCSKPLTRAQARALGDVFTAITTVGVDTEQVGGRWYLAPVRTVADLGTHLLGGMHGDDLFQLLSIGH